MNMNEWILSLVPEKITIENVIFIHQLATTVKKAYAAQKQIDIESLDMELWSLSHQYETPGQVEIFPGVSFYMRQSVHARIQKRYEKSNNWKVIVNDVLLEVYGVNIADYSAIGKKGQRPGINSLLFEGLFDWVNKCENGAVTRREFINVINKQAYNKRKVRKYGQNLEKKYSDDDDEYEYEDSDDGDKKRIKHIINKINEKNKNKKGKI